MVADLALLIDEQGLRVRGVGVNPQLKEVFRLASLGQRDEAMAALQQGREEVGHWLADNAVDCECPVVAYGQPAGALYQALAGHSYGQSPAHYAEGQLTQIARSARALIERKRRKGPTWFFAWRVVEAAGRQIQPWLCVLELDVDGRPLRSSPLYDVRLSL